MFLLIFKKKITVAYNSNASIILFCGSGNSRSCIVISCILLELRICRTIQEAVKIVQEKVCCDVIQMESSYLSILNEFETSYYKRLPLEYIEQCENIIQQATPALVSDDCDHPSDSLSLDQLEDELYTFAKLNSIEFHREKLWQHTSKIIEFLSYPSEKIIYAASHVLCYIVLHSK